MKPETPELDSENRWTGPDGKQYVAQKCKSCWGCDLADSVFKILGNLGDRGCSLRTPYRPNCGFSMRKDGASVIWKEKPAESNPL